MERHDCMENNESNDVVFAEFCTPSEARSDRESQKCGQYNNLTHGNPDNANPDCSDVIYDVNPDDVLDVRQNVNPLNSYF